MPEKQKAEAQQILDGLPEEGLIPFALAAVKVTNTSDEHATIFTTPGYDRLGFPGSKSNPSRKYSGPQSSNVGPA
jgi:hypothetical protein